MENNFFTDDGDDVRTLSDGALNKAIAAEHKASAFGSINLEILAAESRRRDKASRLATSPVIY